MDEVQELCRRVLGPGASADEAAAQARADPGRDRLALLAASAAACRERSEHHDDDARIGELPSAGSPGLAAAVARELALATARLPERQREALALRELLQLSHQQISDVMGIEPASVAPLLARARLRLRSERRGTDPEPGPECGERDRALRVLACRQDSEPVSEQDDTWLLAHLGQCAGCEMAHAAMLEASVCYRAWPSDAELTRQARLAEPGVGADAAR